MKTNAGDVDIIPAADTQAACDTILSSAMFLNSPRMNSLLRFLVAKMTAGAISDTCEYAIGIAVFDRDPSHYNTSEDPIVRVQVRRLRIKLMNYYVTHGTNDDIEISIPTGRYLPIVQWKKFAKNNFKPQSVLAIHPFQYFSHHGSGETFMLSLHDELVHQLFKEFGKIVVAHSFYTPGDADVERRAFNNTSRIGVNKRIEGSAKVDTKHIKISIRMFDTSAGCIVWSEQFKRDLSFAIPCQEELASAICGALKRFLNR